MIQQIKQIAISCGCGQMLPEYLKFPDKNHLLPKQEIISCVMCGGILWTMDTNKGAFDIAMEKKNKKSK